MNEFSPFVNRRHVPSEDISLDKDHEKTSFMSYRTLFEVSGINDSNSGLQITHDMYIMGYFMLLFDLPPDKGTS